MPKADYGLFREWYFWHYIRKIIRQESIAMHELGVVFHIIDSVKEIAAENAVTQVASVTLKLGEVSGVIPDYLTDCWNWAVKRTDVLKGAELIIETIPAVTFCEDCRQEYETVRYGRTCPNCGSGNTYLVQGNEFLIKEIAVMDEAEPES
jgi:hydrogenase nickel incorporation protein HypA/HybF